MNAFEDVKENICKCYKKIKQHLNISIIMLLYYHNWKITEAKQVWVIDVN
jgi:hypothetical protein